MCQIAKNMSNCQTAGPWRRLKKFLKQPCDGLKWFKFKKKMSKCQKDVTLSEKCQIVKRCQMSKSQTFRLCRRFTQKK